MSTEIDYKGFFDREFVGPGSETAAGRKFLEEVEAALAALINRPSLENEARVRYELACDLLAERFAEATVGPNFTDAIAKLHPISLYKKHLLSGYSPFILSAAIDCQLGEFLD